MCIKPAMKCSACTNKNYNVLSPKAIENHLRGQIIAGLYPMCMEETCYFLAIDFDGDTWREDIGALRGVCMEQDIPVYVERSRSGQGAHVWFFFKDKISAVDARKFGSALLTHTMAIRHEIALKSYDRLFPNQDTMPKGGFGNLIALPLQKVARKQNNSVFIDDNFEPYSDQWEFLFRVRRLNVEDVEAFTRKLSPGRELGMLRSDDESPMKPWERKSYKLGSSDFPQSISVIKSNMLYIPKEGISSKGLDYLKRLASFKNPVFYKKQAMRLKVGKTPRVISCGEEDEQYIGLPRGCESELVNLFMELGVWIDIQDRTQAGRDIQIEFMGSLRDEQPFALDALLHYDNGILCGTTAFGKTVVALKLIAERKVNTLILVDRVNLVSQWRKRITEFLSILNDTSMVQSGEEKGRPKKQKGWVGQMVAGKNDLTEIIDIAVIQSLSRGGEVKDLVQNYGMVIVDECHHVSAFSFEKVLKKTDTR